MFDLCFSPTTISNSREVVKNLVTQLIFFVFPKLTCRVKISLPDALVYLLSFGCWKISLGVSSIFIEVDGEMVVLLLKNPTTINLVMEPLLSDCRNLLLIFTNPVVKHVFREINQCADALANSGLLQDCPFVFFFSNPPSMVANLLAFVKAEIFYMCMICN